MKVRTVMPELTNENNLQPNFCTLILSFAASAAMGLGLEPNPDTGKLQKNLELARFNIDLITLLREKTKGNLSSSEHDLVERLITDLQFKFVQFK
jgi:hypothetical protein